MYSRNGMPNVLVFLGSLVLQHNAAQLKGTTGILYIANFTVRRYNLTAQNSRLDGAFQVSTSSIEVIRSIACVMEWY